MDDLIRRQDAIDLFLDKGMITAAIYVERIPSVQPERNTGRWININDGKWNTIPVYKCSACGEINNRVYETDNYCPNCGSKMEV